MYAEEKNAPLREQLTFGKTVLDVPGRLIRPRSLRGRRSNVRRLMLNYPLNYFVVPYLRFLDKDTDLVQLLEERWRLHGGSVEHAIDGAVMLALVDTDGQLTADGCAVSELMQVVGFDLTSAPNARERLVDAAPAVAAIIRLILLRESAVSLIIDALRTKEGGSTSLLDLVQAAHTLDFGLTETLFFDENSARGRRFASSTVHKFKQMLWHVGVLAIGAQGNGGRSIQNYKPEQDIWQLDRYVTQ